MSLVSSVFSECFLLFIIILLAEESDQLNVEACQLLSRCLQFDYVGAIPDDSLDENVALQVRFLAFLSSFLLFFSFICILFFAFATVDHVVNLASDALVRSC